MKILITSGGTKVPLDDVRDISTDYIQNDITNMSAGTFGSKLAKMALHKNHEVIFLMAKDSKSPFDFHASYPIVKSDEYEMWMDFCNTFYRSFARHTYRNFEDYANKLEILVKANNPDVVVLAAAVSDYIAKPSKGKIRSKDDLQINLEHAPKIISKVKQWNPNVKLIGFKLLVNSTEEELIQKARQSITDNGCDFVIANDLASLKAGNHEILIVTPNDVQKHDKNPDREVIALIDGMERDAIGENIRKLQKSGRQKLLVPGDIYVFNVSGKDETAEFSRIGGTGMAIFHPPGEPDTQSSFAIDVMKIIRRATSEEAAMCRANERNLEMDD